MMADAPGDPTNFALIAMRNESTVVAELEADESTEVGYRGDVELERRFIGLLEAQGYRADQAGRGQRRLHPHARATGA